MLDAFIIEKLRKERQERQERQPVTIPLEQPVDPGNPEKNTGRSEKPNGRDFSEVVRIEF